MGVGGMQFVEMIGYAAGLIGLVALLPQIYKSWKTKSTKDLSLKQYLLSATGVALWLIYGILISSSPMIWINVIGLFLGLIMITLKIEYG
jgi:MtN3 and saliva related transmembrane protein